MSSKVRIQRCSQWQWQIWGMIFCLAESIAELPTDFNEVPVFLVKLWKCPSPCMEKHKLCSLWEAPGICLKPVSWLHSLKCIKIAKRAERPRQSEALQASFTLLSGMLLVCDSYQDKGTLISEQNLCCHRSIAASLCSRSTLK